MPSTQEHVAIYARISEDDQGTEAGVTRQLEDARALVAARGWSVVAEHLDNNISATNGAHRPGYQGVLSEVAAGRVSRIVVFHTSRLWRNRRERAEGIELLQRAKVSVSAVKGPELDLATAYGRGLAGLLGEFDTMESEVKRERVARAALQRAENGDPNGAIPFGWQRLIETNERGGRTGARDIHHPDQAPVVREICTRLLAGEPLRAVTERLNQSGIPAPGAAFKLRGRSRGIANPDGARWGKTSVKKIALRPANAGLRMYHAGQPDERLLAAKVEPIITRDQWERLRVMLTAPERKTGKPGARRHLLSWGIGECGICGAVLRVAVKGNNRYGVRQHLYVCDAKACVGRNQDAVDALVRGVVVERLTRPDALDLLAGDDEAANAALDRASALRARLNQVADDYADDKITAEQLRRITAKLQPQVGQAEREAASLRPDLPLDLLAGVAGDAAAEKWDALAVAQRRKIVAVLIERVVIDRVTRRGPGFDPESVRIQWGQS